MPVKVARRGERWCVVEPSGNPIKGGCHDSKTEATKHAAAVNINMHKKNLAFFKDHQGTWHWSGIVSNMWMDREEDILTSGAHRRFVDAIDSGYYAKVFDKPAPDLWLWHVPIPIGVSKTVAYDERGFLIAGGEGHRGPFFDSVFKALAKAEEQNPGEILMSHGMPWEFLEIEKEDSLPDVAHRNIISGYLSEEFTFLPQVAAANLGTGMGGIMVKAMPLQIEDYKRQWFIDTLGEEVVDQFDRRLSEIGKAADIAGIPKKELDVMTDSTDKDQKEAVAAKDALEETGEEKTVEETQTPVEGEKAFDKKPEEDEEDEEKKKKKEEFVTSEALKDVIQEIVDGVAQPVQALRSELEALRKELTDTKAEIDRLKMTEDQRVAQKAAESPQASLSAMIARSIAGQDKARIDYNKERSFATSGPEETESTVDASNLTGIPSVDKMIKEQRKSRGVIPAQMNGQ